MRRAMGRYIALLDADDLWEPDFLEKQLAFMGQTGAICVCSAYRHIDENGREIQHPTVPLVCLEGEARGNPQLLARYRVQTNSTTGNKLKLVSKQYHFYRQYLKHGVLTACLNTLRWGVSGIRKFS